MRFFSRNPRTVDTTRVEKLAQQVQQLLESEAELVPFHGWPHTDFVRAKAAEFAAARGADVPLVEAAALVHDLNYLVAPSSPPSAGRDIRVDLLQFCDFDQAEIDHIECIIAAAHTEHRQRQVDLETACLSDADTLYKTLPITPVLYAHRYLAENRMALGELARKIVEEQVQKLDADFYFYDPALMERYRPWAEANLGLWKEIDEAMKDPAIASLAERTR